MFAMKLMERNLKNFTPDFVARKSVFSELLPEKFSFERAIVVPGSGLSSNSKGRWIVVVPGKRFQSQPFSSYPLARREDWPMICTEP